MEINLERKLGVPLQCDLSVMLKNFNFMRWILLDKNLVIAGFKDPAKAEWIRHQREWK